MLLDTDAIRDSSYNGLQFEGSPKVAKIMFAVDAGYETFKRAALEHADMVVVHHGLFWSGANPSYTGGMKKRIDALCKHGISLYATHLPLDLHRELGNNAQLLKLIGARIEDAFAWYEGRNISYTGVMKKPTPVTAIESSLNTGLNTRCTTLAFGPKTVRTVGVVSGSCSIPHFNEAIHRGMDLFITGEQKDMFHLAKDAGINIIFAGHHASETLGVKALAEVVKKKLKVETVFADLKTGL